jgi:hypothetical protein
MLARMLFAHYQPPGRVDCAVRLASAGVPGGAFAATNWFESMNSMVGTRLAEASLDQNRIVATVARESHA